MTATFKSSRIRCAAILIAFAFLALPTGSPANPQSPQPLSQLHLGMHLHALAVIGNGSIIIFATHGETAMSRDGGRTFTEIPQLVGFDGMEVAAGKSGRVIAVAGHNGAFVSRDGGASWQSLSEHLPGKDTHALGVDATDPNRIVAYVVGEGVFETHDGGGTWIKLSQPPNEPMGTAIVQHGNIMVPAMMPDMNMTGILSSADDGKHWTLVDRNVGGMALAENPQRENVVYLSGMGTLYISGNNGKTWSTRALPATAEVVAPASDGSLYAAGYPDKHGILWHSGDNGMTWTRISH